MTPKFNNPQTEAERSRKYRERHRTKPKTAPLTSDERDKRRDDKQFNFKEVRLHLVSCVTNEHCLEAEGFSFKYRPRKEDIYYNFSGIDYKEDILNIGYQGLNYYKKGRKSVFYQIIKYRKTYPKIIIIDERTPEQKQYKDLTYTQGSILHLANKEGWNIVNECEKHDYSVSSPFDTHRTKREIFIDDTKNPFNNNKYFPGIEDERLFTDISGIEEEEELIAVMREALNLPYKDCVKIIGTEALEDYLDGMNNVQRIGRDVRNRLLLHKTNKHCWENPCLVNNSWKTAKELSYVEIIPKIVKP
jgi:hypothetical protein